MAIEVFYETRGDLEGAGFPILYQVYKNDDLEIGRSIADFLTAPEEVVVTYVAELKTYMAGLITLIPESSTISSLEKSNIVKLVSAATHLIDFAPILDDTFSIAVDESESS
jgi:hypothetical protein